MTKESRWIMPECKLLLLMIAALMLFFVIWTLPGRTVAQGPADDQPQLVQVVQSKKLFAQTVGTFQEEVSKAGWSVLNVNNMAGVLSERGFTLRPVMILDVCSGQYSARILSNDDYRPISAFMPCRVSIYQTSDEKVFIARMNTNAFVAMMPAEVAEVMSASDEEIAKIIANTVR